MKTFSEVKRVLKLQGEFHVADWGLPDGLMMKLSFGIIGLLDGFETTADNFEGLLPKLMADAGFDKLAKRSRVNLETIRYYERKGLLSKPPRSPSGYRAFPRDTVGRVRFIKQAQELGFSLKEIKELLALQVDPESTSADVRKRTEAKIADIEEKMKILWAMKKALTNLTIACSGKGAVCECSILKSLGSIEG